MNTALVYKPLRPKHAAHPSRPAPDRRAHGAEAGLPQFVQRSTHSRQQVPVQRDEPSTALPPVPNYQLTPPSLLQRPQSPSLLSPEHQLRLGPNIQVLIQQTVTPERIASGLMGRLGLNWTSGVARQAEQSEGPQPAPAVSVPPAPTTSSSSTVAPTPPLVTNVPPSPGFGIFLGMAMAHPTFNQAVMRLQQQGLNSWNQLGTGGQVALVSSTATVLVGGISVLMSDPRYRAETLSLLSGKVIGIPFTPVSVEMNLQGENIMFGLHLDLGSLMPERFGFRSASPVGPFPMLEQMPPLQRDADQAATVPAEADLGQRIQTASGGRPLDAPTQRRLEHSLDVQLPAVQLHTDAEADQLTRSVGARAFTSGAHIFFRADTQPATASDGMRLLAHEALHTAQQTAGPVAGTPAPGGVALSDPGDRFEREAAHKAERVAPSQAPDSV